MDENKENSSDNQDLVVGNDGSMNKGANIEVKTESNSGEEPVVNDLQPPPTTDNKSKEDKTDVETAVSFIAGDNSDSKENSDPVTEENNESDVTEESTTNDTQQENVAEVKEQEVNLSEPELSEPISSQSESSSDSFETLSAPQTAITPDADTTSASSNMPNNEHPHRNNKKLAIIITIVVALIMTGAAIYVFVSAQDNAEEATRQDTNSIPEQSEAQVEPATEADVEQTINEIDQTLQSVDETDLGEETISDDTLGL